MPKKEFTVANEYHYNQSSAIRWISSHLMRYKGYFAAFVVGLMISGACYSAISSTIGTAFDLVLAPSPDPSQLILVAVTILGLVLLHGVSDLGGNLAIEVLGQRLERDARD